MQRIQTNIVSHYQHCEPKMLQKKLTLEIQYLNFFIFYLSSRFFLLGSSISVMQVNAAILPPLVI